MTCEKCKEYEQVLWLVATKACGYDFPIPTHGPDDVCVTCAARKALGWNYAGMPPDELRRFYEKKRTAP